MFLVARDRMQDNKQDDEISIGDRVIPNDATVKALKSLGATFNFIEIWLHNFCDYYFDRSKYYRVAMVEMFKKIPQNVEKPLTTREKNQKLITDIGGGFSTFCGIFLNISTIATLYDSLRSK